MRLLIIFILLSLSACDNQSRGNAQADSAPKDELSDGALGGDAASDPQSYENFSLESANGLNANLSYDNRGEPMPLAEFNAPDGSSLTLERYRGRPILLNLWATYCVPCRVEMPTLDNLAAIEEGQLTVLTVSQDLQGGNVVRPYFEKFQFQNIQGFTDRKNNLWNALRANSTIQLALPSTILYDSSGREVWRVVGGLEWDDAEVAKLLRQAR